MGEVQTELKEVDKAHQVGDTNKGVKRDKKNEGEAGGEEKRQKTKDKGGIFEDLEEIFGEDRGQASKKARTSDTREDEGMSRQQRKLGEYSCGRKSPKS